MESAAQEVVREVVARVVADLAAMRARVVAEWVEVARAAARAAEARAVEEWAEGWAAATEGGTVAEVHLVGNILCSNTSGAGRSAACSHRSSRLAVGADARASTCRCRRGRRKTEAARQLLHVRAMEYDGSVFALAICVAASRPSCVDWNGVPVSSAPCQRCRRRGRCRHTSGGSRPVDRTSRPWVATGRRRRRRRHEVLASTAVVGAAN